MPPKIEPIGPDHETVDFDCGQASLNDWLIKRALSNHQQGYTHVRVATDASRVTGYYGIASSSILTSGLPRAVRGGQPPNPLPGVLIGRFAVDLKSQGRGLGQSLFQDALYRSVAVSQMIAARAVIIRALDERAASFYRNYGFIATDADPLTLYQSIQRIAASL